MSAKDPPPPRAEVALDWLFTHFESKPRWPRPPADAAPQAPGEPPAAGPEPPPAVRNAGDLRAANEWFQREWQRFQQYTQLQLGRIQEEHQALVRQSYANEQKLIQKSQELSRLEEVLARQSRVIQRQAADLSGREQALAAQLEQWSRGPARDVRPPAEAGAAPAGLLDSLRAETAAL